MVVVSSEILTVYEQVVVLVELPELAVDDVEVLVAEEVRHLWVCQNSLNQWKIGRNPLKTYDTPVQSPKKSANFDLFWVELIDWAI